LGLKLAFGSSIYGGDNHCLLQLQNGSFNLSTLEYLFQALEIFFKYDLVINRAKQGNVYFQEILDQISMLLCQYFDALFLNQDNNAGFSLSFKIVYVKHDILH